MPQKTPLIGLGSGEPIPARAEEIQHIVWALADRDTSFTSAKVKHLYDWWTAANGGGMPLRRTFDVTEHRAIVANLFLVRVLSGGRFRFELQGENVTRLLSGSDARRTIGTGDDNAYDRALAEYYQLIVDDPRCRVCTGNLKHLGRSFVRVESIDCPLTDDGVTVSAILGALDSI